MFLGLPSAPLRFKWPPWHNYLAVLVKLRILYHTLIIPWSLKNKNPTTRLVKKLPAPVLVKRPVRYSMSVFVCQLKKKGWELRGSESVLFLLHRQPALTYFLWESSIPLEGWASYLGLACTTKAVLIWERPLNYRNIKSPYSLVS